jgi:MerR family redox-sensitive transcriptional activator SoxR
MADPVPIGEIVRRSGVPASALRFYEEKGLIRSERAESGRRHYPRAVLRRIAFIVFAQRIGMSLDEIRGELEKLPEDRVPEGADWARLSRAWTRRIDEQIELLSRLRESLTGCIGCGCLSLGRCKLANPQDRAARQGAGARYWLGDRPRRA